MKTIFINQSPVELYKILKFEALVHGGGEAKMAIANGMVLLNGEIESQKRKKVNAGDTIEFDGEQFQIKLDDGSNKPKPTKSIAVQQTQTSEAQTTIEPVEKPKRTAIRF
ncbi:MAG: ribosome-associated protein [Phenylobacterium sp.]|jgi:ribosome-associated protein